MRKHVHFIGIAGKTMAPLAKMFKDMGWSVTGSDHEAVYPPITTYLEENKIDFVRGYDEKNITGKPNLVVIGRSALLVDKENPEVAKAKELGCQILSYPEILRDFLVKENSIVVAGTYGKTTIAALVAWILEKAGLNPSFMTGGVPFNFPDGIRNTDSLYSVVEGDETPAMAETDPPKFLFYQPKYVILTAAQRDHPEVFKTEEAYLEAFYQLVRLIPENGLLVACKEGKNNALIVKEAKCRVIWYSSQDEKADYYLEEVKFGEKITTFKIKSKGKIFFGETGLLGKHNSQNITGAVALAQELGLPGKATADAVKTFLGLRTRLENLGTFNDVTVFWDFAQHPVKVRESLAALRIRYPENKIYCVFDPHGSLLQQRESLAWYPGNFDLADQVVVTKVTFPKDKPSREWVKGPEIVKVIIKTQPQVFYEPIDEKVINYLVKEVPKDNLIVFMSSGGLRITQMIEGLIQRLKQR